MILVTHPENLKKIRSLCVDDDSIASSMHLFHSGYKIIECDFMPPTRPSGMYSINGRGRIAKEDFSFKTPFITYGPEDFDYLVYAGVVKEIQDLNILCMHEQQWDFFRQPLKELSFLGGDSRWMLSDYGFGKAMTYRHPAMYFGNTF